MTSDITRREFLLKSLTLLAGTTLCGPLRAAARHDTLSELSAVAAVQAMRNGEISAEDYASALLSRAHSLESLNAFRTLDREQLLQAARAADIRRKSGAALGLLHGLPIPVKDSVNTRDLPTSNGTLALRDFRPREDALVLKPLFAQGGILMGKTNLHEISRGWTSNNGAFGAVRNPYDAQRIPGGSSGGSAVAVAARIAPLAIAEDTVGSIRVPSTMSGVMGLRPTFGRYPNGGIMPLSLDKFDQVGPLARSVADLALFDSVVTGDSSPLATRPLRGARFAVSEFMLSGLDPEVERIVDQALAKLQAAGATLVRVEIPQIAQQAMGTAVPIFVYENVRSISAFLEQQQTGVSFEALRAQLSPNIKVLYDTAPDITRGVYDAAVQESEHIRSVMREYFQVNAIEALVFPTTLTAALPLGDNFEIEIRGEKVPIRTVMGRNTALGSVASLASLVVPAGMTAGGLPVGIEFDAMSGRDRTLLSLGLAIESAFGSIPAPDVRHLAFAP
jgi:Asp-tRNA(Asn)/Glu-tRNA(Gln) amidotransferase A subunit family amidase